MKLWLGILTFALGSVLLPPAPTSAQERCPPGADKTNWGWCKDKNLQQATACASSLAQGRPSVACLSPEEVNLVGLQCATGLPVVQTTMGQFSCRRTGRDPRVDKNGKEIPRVSKKKLEEWQSQCLTDPTGTLDTISYGVISCNAINQLVELGDKGRMPDIQLRPDPEACLIGEIPVFNPAGFKEFWVDGSGRVFPHEIPGGMFCKKGDFASKPPKPSRIPESVRNTGMKLNMAITFNDGTSAWTRKRGSIFVGDLAQTDNNYYQVWRDSSGEYVVEFKGLRPPTNPNLTPQPYPSPPPPPEEFIRPSPSITPTLKPNIPKPPKKKPAPTTGLDETWEDVCRVFQGKEPLGKPKKAKNTPVIDSIIKRCFGVSP